MCNASACPPCLLAGTQCKATTNKGGQGVHQASEAAPASTALPNHVMVTVQQDSGTDTMLGHSRTEDLASEWDKERLLVRRADWHQREAERRRHKLALLLSPDAAEVRTSLQSMHAPRLICICTPPQLNQCRPAFKVSAGGPGSTQTASAKNLAASYLHHVSTQHSPICCIAGGDLVCLLAPSVPHLPRPHRHPPRGP
jgi:hypothetical protein